MVKPTCGLKMMMGLRHIVKKEQRGLCAPVAAQMNAKNKAK